MVSEITKPFKKNTRKIFNIIAPLLVILLFITISIISIQNKSDTTDEKFHLTRGVMLLETGDLRLNQHHPYLFNLIAALPTKFDKDLITPDLDSENWIYSKKDEISFEFVDLNGGRIEFSKNVLFGPRFTMILVTGILLYLLYYYASKLFSYKVAFILLILFAFDPNFIAHARLVTTDAASTITIFLSILAFYDFIKNKEKIKEKGIRSLLFLAFTITIALLSKYTAVFTTVTLLLILFIYNFLKNTDCAFFARIFKSAKQPFLLVVMIVLMLSVAYKFQFSVLADMTYGNEAKLLANLDGFTTIKRTSETVGNILEYIYLNIPLPFPQYINGFYENVFKHNIFGHRSFLLGEFSNGGWWYYFPITLLVKEPIFTIFGFVTSILSLMINSMRSKSLKWLNIGNIVLILPPLIIFLLSIQSTINLGIRHLLPIFPFIYLLIAISIYKLRKKYTFKYIYTVFIVLIISLIPTLRIFPHYISYFNAASGKPNDGYKIVRDSNFDWNQNDIYVQDYIAKHPDLNITIDPAKYDDYNYIILAKEDLYGNPEKMPVELKYLNDLLDTGYAEIIEDIALTHVLIQLNK